jgi:FMN phosphatase YigB (HAD superfamily)
VRPDEAIHVGDHLDADVQGAQGVGIGAVLIDRRGRFRPEEVPDGVPVISTLAELIPIVDARSDRASA